MDRPFPAYTGDEPFVFVSYSHTDSAVVFRELAWLKQRGFNIWYDEGIEAGAEWREEIGKAIKKATLLLYFVSPESANSENCRKEVGFADKEHIPIVAIHLKKTALPEGLDLTLSDRQAILKYEVSGPEYQQKLQSRITSYLDGQTKSPPIPKKKNPGLYMAGVAGSIIMIVMLVFLIYNRQDWQSTDATLTDAELGSKYSIAVLPFANMSSDKNAGHFADGLSEDILDNLARHRFISAASRTTSSQFSGISENSSLIGEKLNVAYLLEGSVRQRGDIVRITAQLIRADDGFHVWSKPYERNLTAGFAMQTAVATNIAHISGEKLILDVANRYGWRFDPRFDGIDADVNQVALGFFLQALNESVNLDLGEAGDFETYVQLLKNSVKADPGFSPGYLRLANTYFLRHRVKEMPVAEARAAATVAIENAIASGADNFNLDLQQVQIHLRYELDYGRAAAKLRELQTLAPTYSATRYLSANIDMREGRTSEALQQLANLSALGANTEDAIILAATAHIRNVGGEYEGALEATSRGLELALAGPDRVNNLWIRAHSLVMLDKTGEARLVINEAWNLDRSFHPERYISLFAYIGEIEKANSILTDSRFNLVDTYQLAMGHLALGNIDNTLKSIQAGIDNHNPLLLVSLMAAEVWNPIRDDPRFIQMLKHLDSKVRHTEQYLQDHNIPTKNRTTDSG